MTGNPLVTLYILNHNYGRYIEEAIQSVMNQTFDDFELIIIDDGSSDDSRKTIEKYDHLPKVVTIFQKNKGLNVSNNIAMRASRGKYLMRLDADDYLDENALSVLSGVLERNPNVGLVFPDYYVVDAEGKVTDTVRRHDFTEVTMLDQPAHGACTLIRKQFLENIGGYDETFRCQDGYDLWLRFIQKYEIRNVNLPLFYYRQHSCNITNNEEQILQTRAEILEKQAKGNGSQYTAMAVIPVRGAAVDPASAALRELAGEPLIDWTIKAALGAQRVSRVVLTTPDEELIEYVHQKYDDRVFLVQRYRELAAFNTYIEDTMIHALEEVGRVHQLPELLCLLYIEAPFRTSKHIDNAIDALELFDADTVVAVRPETDVIYQHDGCGLQPVRKSRTLRLEREDLLREVGRMHVIKRKFLEKERQVVGGKVGHVVLDKTAAWRVSSDWDWELAEMMAPKIRKNQGS